MKFPDRPRVLYEANPLVEVNCFISFPRILALESELPVDFQNALVSKYPLLETQHLQRPATEGDTEPSRLQVYEFRSADREVTIALSAEFIAIRVSSYRKWEVYREHVRTALLTLLRIYNLSVITGIVLNYINVIEREAVGLDGVSWSELIRSSLIGPFAEETAAEESISEHRSRWSLNLEEGDLQISSGLVTTSDNDENVSFLIDNMFTRDESLEADEHKIISVLERFNAESGRVFRWCIHDRLHEALRPGPIS
jgi:uncharacterized protein (TIGR04255 family)